MAHLPKWARRRLRKIDGMDWFKARMRRLLKDLPANGGLESLRLERLVRDAEAQNPPPMRGVERQTAGAR